MKTFSLSRKTLMVLFATSAMSMASFAFAQTSATTPPPAQPANAPMQEGNMASATDPASAPMASTDKPKSWKELDTNKDGKISKDEAAADPTLATDFDSADANKDGYLSKAEFKKHESEQKKLAQGGHT